MATRMLQTLRPLAPRRCCAGFSNQMEVARLSEPNASIVEGRNARALHRGGECQFALRVSKGACNGRPRAPMNAPWPNVTPLAIPGAWIPSATASASPPAVPVQIPDVGMPVTWDNAVAPKATCPWALISGVEKGLPPAN